MGRFAPPAEPATGIAVVGPAALVFGRAVPGIVKSKRLEVRNASRSACLAVQVGPAEAPFRGGGTFVLRPRETLTLAVAFASTDAGSFASTLEVRTSDPARPQIDVALSGESFSFEKR